MKSIASLANTIGVMTWIGWALLSALFAAATALLAKVGVAHVDSNLATAVRTTVVVFFAWGIALARALQLGPASRVAPLDKLSVPLVMLFAWLLLGEKITAPTLAGGLLITAGAVVMVLG